MPFFFCPPFAHTLPVGYDFQAMTSKYENNLAPEVSPADLQAVWTVMQEFGARVDPAQASSIDIRTFERVCSPDANVRVVWSRTVMLQIMTHINPGWDAKLDRAKIFEVAARFPLKIMEPGLVHDQPPFDVREFMKQVAAR